MRTTFTVIASLSLGVAAGAAWADETTPAPEPKLELVVPRDTPLENVKLSCPPKAKQIGGKGQLVDDATYCAVPPPVGGIPLRQGPAVNYHPNGKMSAQGSYANGKRHGAWVSWDDEGHLASYAHYAGGEYDGAYMTWWSNGTRQSEIQWKAGKKHGLSRSWDSDGKPLAFTTYENDTAVKQTVFGPDGKPRN